ncbi:Isy1 protein [Saccharomycopsis crataegensis]|uniref:Pre-mRNA-splicing factor ISY1 n=1 Tax=Saccharomycopsis crataegensis TaxID=43959 RepID=A0AAV5QIT7_9ASCO|nr:Isy1 protein [Saccharomycopsis crataegensis]
MRVVIEMYDTRVCKSPNSTNKGIMSRNKEKAQSLLHQLEDKRALDLGYININKLRRPRNVATVKDVKMAEKWRGQVNQEINSKILKLYDDMINDYQIRDLNDQVNKLFREKSAWEYRIKELGGPNYMKFSSHTNKDEFVVRNYRYFGRAKELKEVKQLIQLRNKEMGEMHKKSKNSELEYFNKKLVYDKQNKISFEYYGYDMLADSEMSISVDDDIRAEISDVLGEEFIPNDTKSSILYSHSTNGSKASTTTESTDGLNDPENNLSKSLMKKLMQEYSKSDTLKKYQGDNHVDKINENFMKVLLNDNCYEIPSIKDTEVFLVERKKMLMLKSLGL